ncbi:GTPase HflX [Alphaproteobacteria bacterium]|nr:GTPase HflX [Alphaproteobacteria bacterium]
MQVDSENKNNRVMIVYPIVSGGGNVNPDWRLQETIGLAKAINLQTVHYEYVNLKVIKSATLFGQGVIDRLHDVIHEKEVGLFIVDSSLSPIQQRNLEKKLNIKVIDRTALILEIFGARARTFEGKLQVELAHLTYQRSRLVRAWTHLERQRGGFGFIGGPGESQLEIDRRLADDTISKIKRKIERVKKTRSLQRRARKRVPYPVVAIVGYTNAGKSSLFNHLTGSDVFAKDLLFATLDPTMRLLKLPCGTNIILSDTVGFISDLPYDLVASFRATLEEVVSADVILHIRDLSSLEFDNHGNDVMQILDNLNVNKDNKPIIEVWNKCDIIDDDKRYVIENQLLTQDDKYICSVYDNYGIQQILQSVSDALHNNDKKYLVELPLSAGAENSWIKSKSRLLSEEYDESGASLIVEMPIEISGKFYVKFPDTNVKISQIEK